MTVKAGGGRYAVHGASRKRDEEGGEDGGAEENGEGDVNMANGWAVIVCAVLVCGFIAVVAGANVVWLWRSTWGWQ
jgi:hypothetical protein